MLRGCAAVFLAHVRGRPKDVQVGEHVIQDSFRRINLASKSNSYDSGVPPCLPAGPRTPSRGVCGGSGQSTVAGSQGQRCTGWRTEGVLFSVSADLFPRRTHLDISPAGGWGQWTRQP